MSNHVKSSQSRPFFTPKALADYLSLSDRSVRRMLAEGEIPSYRVAGSRRINPDDVDRYLTAHRDDPAGPETDGKSR